MAATLRVWFDSSIINRGSLDGVKFNMPIVTDGGLVGRVTAVSPLTAQVDLITSDKSGLGARDRRDRYLERSRRGQRYEQERSARDAVRSGTADVQVGQTVYTTGQDGIYPAGSEGRRDRGDPLGFGDRPHQIFIKPAAKLNSMQEVGVLLYEPPPKTEFEQKLPNAVKTR